MLWTLASNHGFEVKTYYKPLWSEKTCLFPWKSTWKVKSQRHMAFFTWTTAFSRILMIILEGKISLFLTDVAYAKRMRR
jgi:hypothetical protein